MVNTLIGVALFRLAGFTMRLKLSGFWVVGPIPGTVNCNQDDAGPRLGEIQLPGPMGAKRFLTDGGAKTSSSHFWVPFGAVGRMYLVSIGMETLSSHNMSELRLNAFQVTSESKRRFLKLQ